MQVNGLILQGGALQYKEVHQSGWQFMTVKRSASHLKQGKLFTVQGIASHLRAVYQIAILQLRVEHNSAEQVDNSPGWFIAIKGSYSQCSTVHRS